MRVSPQTPTIDTVVRARHACDGGHAAAGGDLANGGVVGIGHIHVACGIDGNALRIGEQSGSTDAVGAPRCG